MKTLPWAIIALLLLVILYLRECSPKAECPPGIVRVDTITGDTVIQDTIIYKPHLVYQDTGSTRWLSQKIDTAAILAACMAVNCYRDTLKNDTSALVVVENEVSMNELHRTRMEFLNRRDKLILYNQSASNNYSFNVYVGVNMYRNNQKASFGGSIYLQIRRQEFYGISYFPSSKWLVISIVRKLKIN